MALQMAVSTRNGMLDAIDTDVGTTANFTAYSGAQPADVTQSNPSGALISINLNNPAFGSASGGSMAKNGTLSGTASGTGTPASWRIYNSTGTKDGTTCKLQGSAGVGSGDVSFDGTITSGQTVTINTLTLNAANA